MYKFCKSQLNFFSRQSSLVDQLWWVKNCAILVKVIWAKTKIGLLGHAGSNYV